MAIIKQKLLSTSRNKRNHDSSLKSFRSLSDGEIYQRDDQSCRSRKKDDFSLKSFVRSWSDGAIYQKTGYQSHGNGIRKGFVPVLVGSEEMNERFMIRTQLIKHPSIVALLELSADEFGYKQEGVLQIPCRPELFRETVNKLSKTKWSAYCVKQLKNFLVWHHYMSCAAIDAYK